MELGKDKTLVYEPSKAGIDTGDYELLTSRFSNDMVGDAEIEDLHYLAVSPDWQDRVRAEILRRDISITLPDGFPCIYETADSPNNSKSLNPRPQPWVVSPDTEMLHRLLPDYQELWDSYTSQWGSGSRRIFAVGLLDGVAPNRVHRPGTTPETVIGSTLLTHEAAMYATAPERLKRMHPLYKTWMQDKVN